MLGGREQYKYLASTVLSESRQDALGILLVKGRYGGWVNATGEKDQKSAVGSASAFCGGNDVAAQFCALFIHRLGRVSFGSSHRQSATSFN